MRSSRLAGLVLALCLALPAAAARAQEAAKPAPLAPFDAAGCREIAGDGTRKPADRIAGLLAILDGRLADWRAVAAGTRTADPARDDRGREISVAVACLVTPLQEESAAGGFKAGLPALSAACGERKAADLEALRPWWDLACLLAGVRPSVPEGVTALLAKERDGTLLSMTLRALEGRCPPGALAGVLRLLDHPESVRGADGRDLHPVRIAAVKVLAALGVTARFPERMEGNRTVPTGEPPVVEEGELVALVRKWLHSDVEEEWRGALAVVRDRGDDVLVAAASIEMGVKGIPLPKLEAISEVLDAIDARAAGEGK